MKKNALLSILSLAGALALATSCADDLGHSAAAPGDYINFSARTSGPASRTVYGDRDGNKFPVYWVENDKVRIFSPEAYGTTAAEKTSDYIVGTIESGKNLYQITGGTLKWGEPEVHNFFEVYPAQAVNSFTMNGSACDVVLDLPNDQHVSYQGTVTDNNKDYQYYTNMNYAYMAGTTQANRTSAESITLPFEPLTTAVDIFIEPNANWTIKSINIANPSSVSAVLAQPLAGQFTKRIGGTGAVTVDPDHVHNNVSVEFGTGITLDKGIKVTAFLLPTYNDSIRIEVLGDYNNASAEISLPMKRVKTSSALAVGGAKKLAPGLKNVIHLGALPNYSKQQSQGEFTTYEDWMAGIPGNAYLSALSIPGTYDSGSYNSLIKPSLKAQNCDVSTQLQLGARVLDFQSNYDGSGAFILSATSKTTGGITGETLENVLTQMRDWLAVHTTETVIVILRNESTADNQAGWRANIGSFINGIPGITSYSILNPATDMTMADARGKIIFWLLDPLDNNQKGWNMGWSEKGTVDIYSATSTTTKLGSLKINDDHCLRAGTENAETKLNSVKTIFPVSPAADHKTWNYTSLAYTENINGNKTTDWTYDSQATKVNKWLVDNKSISGLSASTYQSTGIVLVTMVGSETDDQTYYSNTVMRQIVDNNFKKTLPAAESIFQTK